MEIILKKPTIEYAKDIIKFRKEIFEAKSVSLQMEGFTKESQLWRAL